MVVVVNGILLGFFIVVYKGQVLVICVKNLFLFDIVFVYWYGIE